MASALLWNRLALAEKELKTGRIVSPLAGLAKDVEYVGHHLVYPRASRQRPGVRVFTEWLLTELGLPLPS